MQDYINRQVEERARAWGEAKELLDHAASESRDLTAEEQAKYDRINADLDERTAVIERLQKDADREARAAEIRVPEVHRPSSDADLLRSMSHGQAHSFEKRDMTTVNNGGIVPEGFYAVLQEQLRYTGPWLNENVGFTIITTGSGEDIKVPIQSTFSAATATAEAAAFVANNPTTTNKTLRAHKYGTLVTVSREILSDSGVDLVGFIARQGGNAIGNIVNQRLAVGTGTAEPEGLFLAAGTGKKGTAVAFSADDLIDLVHSVDSQYAQRPSAGFMMSRATLSTLRKLRDGAGQFIYDPTQGTQALLLGYPVFENPHAPAIGSGLRSVAFGDMSYYHVRQVASVEVARSDDAFFVNDLAAFRLSVRVDGLLSQPDAVKVFEGVGSAV
jgi:HK97 family phage major capsid protein